jgi:hypothetical protein
VRFIVFSLAVFALSNSVTALAENQVTKEETKIMAPADVVKIIEINGKAVYFINDQDLGACGFPGGACVRTKKDFCEGANGSWIGGACG